MVGVQATELRLCSPTILHAAITRQDSTTESVNHVLICIHTHLQANKKENKWFIIWLFNHLGKKNNKLKYDESINTNRCNSVSFVLLEYGVLIVRFEFCYFTWLFDDPIILIYFFILSLFLTEAIIMLSPWLCFICQHFAASIYLVVKHQFWSSVSRCVFTQ